MDGEAIGNLVKKTTNKWAKQRKAEERNTIAAARRRDAMTRTYRVTFKDAAYQVMEDAYMKASAHNTLPAAARQIMYAARGRIQQMTGRMLNDQYFCQTLLPDFMAEHPVLTADWDVVFDARGNFRDPTQRNWYRSGRCRFVAIFEASTRAKNRIQSPTSSSRRSTRPTVQITASVRSYLSRRRGSCPCSTRCGSPPATTSQS